MPAYTSPDNIQYPVSGDQVAPLETVFANMAQSTQNAFDGFRSDWNDFEANRAIQTFRWADATARAAQTGMVAGDVGYQVDTATDYVYTGSAWRFISTPFAQAAGLATTTTTSGSGNSTPFFWSGVESVTFPVGRFSIAPLVVASPASNSSASILPGVQVHDITTSGFTYRVFRIGAAPAVGTAIHWEAVQMTAASAAG